MILQRCGCSARLLTMARWYIVDPLIRIPKPTISGFKPLKPVYKRWLNLYFGPVYRVKQHKIKLRTPSQVSCNSFDPL